MKARQLHRGTMTVAAFLIVYWVISGLTIAIVDATDRYQAWAILGGGPGARLNDNAAAARSVPAPDILSNGIAKALSSTRNMPIAGVDYRMTGDIPRLELSEANGERDTELRFYAETGEPMSPLVADGDPFRAPPVYTRLRERIKSFHKGDAFGLPGQLIGLLTGGALIVMTLSGLVLYLQLWRARRRVGQAGLFWKSRESAWRRLHRIVAIVAAVFVLNKAVTGTILAWGEFQTKLAVVYHILSPSYPMPTPLPPYSEDRLSGDLLGALQRGFDAALQAAPSAPIVWVELVRRGGQSKALVTIGGSRPQTLAFDMLSGVPVDDWAIRGTQKGNGYFADWHQILKRMHRGDIIGHFAGRYVDITFGIALLYLVTSGMVLYVQMFKRRTRAGQFGLFWK
jgi:uncharacterized iron-regulated membrane protein